MVQPKFSSPAIAKEMARVFSSGAKKVVIKMQHEAEVKNYVCKIEEAHKKASASKLRFR